MKKQLLLLMMMFLPLIARADDSGACGTNLTWSYVESTQTLTISGTGDMTDYMFYYNTWGTHAPWYSYRLEIVKAIIEDGVTSIGGIAFYGCSGLASVTISNSVTSIGDGAFSGCSSLTSVTIPNSVTSIGNEAFNDCSSLTSVTIPNSVTSIGSHAFNYCSYLTSVTIPNSVTSIGGGAFSHCSSLTSVMIPNSVTSIQGWTFSHCSSLTSVTIPNSVTYIGDGAFYGCSELTSITIPNSVTSIGDDAFEDCRGLTSVHISDLVAWCKISFSGGVSNPLYFAHHLYMDGSEITNLVIPNSMTTIGKEAFYGCSGLTSVTIPDNVTNIGDYAFAECSSLTSVTIPNSVTTIGESAFYGCSNIIYINISENLQIIKRSAFCSCARLTTITIPASVEFIYQEAFSDCNNLEYVKVLPETPPFLYDNSFSNFTIPLKVPKGCKEVYQNSQGWKNFTNISDADKFKLIYMVDNEVYKFYEIEEGTTITPEPAPTKEGYTFSGWSKIPETMPAHDVTVTGTFSINKYKLTYTVDGEEYKSYEVEYGATITPETAPTKEGNTFSGWSEIPETMPAHDVTVTGTFSINKYTLKYMIDDSVYKTVEYEYGATITPEATPTKEGYSFSGWSEIPETMPAHDVTVTGTFAINKYKLTYTVDGAEYKTYEIEYGAAITPEAEPTKDGYTFSGWSEIPETMPARDVTVTGTFSINKYKLVYIVDGVEYKSYEFEYGTSITPEAEPTKEGYTFSGWSEMPETMPDHDVTVTGTFAINKYKLTYTVDGAEYKTYEIEYGAAITPEAEPTKDGYTFSGWSEIPETMPARDVTVTGTFSINKYKLVYIVDGVEYKSYEFEYGTSITPEAEPTKEGYTFSGWSEMPETMPDHDVTVKGIFTINKYKLTYIVDGTEYKTYEIEYNATITAEAEPSKEGYTFSGWSEIPKNMPAQDVTITGSFCINSYKLTYMIDDEVYKEVTYEYGATIMPEPTPDGDYDSFEWIDLPQTMPAHDVVVYASYTSEIIEVIIASQQNVRIYSPNGKKLNKLQKGLNIVILNDGTVKKVIMK